MLTQKRLKELMHYDEETGKFTRLVSTNGKYPVGQEVGFVNGGYRCTQIGDKSYKLHRLAFLYVDGYTPEFEVDHEDGDTLNNSWGNLRHVGRSCQMQNISRRKDNTSGFTGVSLVKSSNKWTSRISINGKRIELGRYDSALEAGLARITAEDWCPDWHCDSRCDNRKRVLEALKK